MQFLDNIYDPKHTSTIGRKRVVLYVMSVCVCGVWIASYVVVVVVVMDGMAQGQVRMYGHSIKNRSVSSHTRVAGRCCKLKTTRHYSEYIRHLRQTAAS